MILLNEVPFNGILKGTMMLTDDEGNNIFVSRSTYDQALRIAVKYDDSFENVQRDGFNEGPDYQNDMYDGLIYKMGKLMPYPINMLAPFIIILRDMNTELITEDTTVIDLYGYLHVLSQSLDFYSYLLIDEKMRNNPRISTYLYKTYKDNWNECSGNATGVSYLAPVQSAEVKASTPVYQEVNQTVVPMPDIQQSGDTQSISVEKLLEFNSMWDEIATPKNEEEEDTTKEPVKKEPHKKVLSDVSEDVDDARITSTDVIKEFDEEFKTDAEVEEEEEEDDTDV